MVANLAARLGCTERYIRQILKLAFLAPDITQAILHGEQPRHLTLAAVLAADLPLSWSAQRKALGLLPKS